MALQIEHTFIAKHNTKKRVFGTTHDATGETKQIVLIAAFVLLPVAAFLFWRVVKKFVFEEQ